MSISASDIQKIVAAEDDFGHEMRVGAAIQAVPGFEVQHGGTYTDPVTGKPRQFDYRCSLKKGTTTLVLAVECKNLNPAFPLIICGTGRREGEAFHDLIYSLAGGATATQAGETVVGPRSATYRALRNQSFYRTGGFVGKSLLRLKPEGGKSAVPVAGPDSDVYEKWAQALSSAVELVKIAFDCAQLRPTIVSAILPAVVVTDESLWKVSYGCDGKMASAPELVDQCEFYVGRRVRNMPDVFMFSHIHFFTLSAFASFLSKMAVNDHAWETLFDSGLLRFGPG
jgi:hypothetical protein